MVARDGLEPPTREFSAIEEVEHQLLVLGLGCGVGVRYATLSDSLTEP